MHELQLTSQFVYMQSQLAIDSRISRSILDAHSRCHQVSEQEPLEDSGELLSHLDWQAIDRNILIYIDDLDHILLHAISKDKERIFKLLHWLCYTSNLPVRLLFTMVSVQNTTTTERHWFEKLGGTIFEMKPFESVSEIIGDVSGLAKILSAENVVHQRVGNGL